jgi:8-oxo-dGTP pyrophosphatase MutT (NUDIX family)
MRGKYTDEESIISLLDQTTIEERDRLLKKSFVDLWRLLWNGPASRRYHIEYEQAKSKHDSLLISGKLAVLIASTKTTWTEAEWGFPKGRRSSIETELACALRETYEEAGIPKDKLRITDVAPLIEEFRGSNGIRYRHKYWLAQAPATLEVGMNPANLDQAREISDVRWCTYEEAMALIRPYNVEKRNLLEKANGLLKTS